MIRFNSLPALISSLHSGSMHSWCRVHLFLPLFAAIIYTVASLFFKQGYLRGATSTQTFHVSNMIGGLIFLPLWIFGGHIDLVDLWHPALVAGLILFAGFTMFLSIRLGDISLVTPLMGTKVIFVAIAQVFITGEALSTGLWIASLLTMVGILLIGYKDLRNSRAGLAGILLAILSSLSFGVSDVFMQQWAPLYGKVAFLGAVAGMVGLFSVVKLSMSRWGGMNFVPGAFRPVEPDFGGAGDDDGLRAGILPRCCPGQCRLRKSGPMVACAGVPDRSLLWKQ